MDIFQEKIQTIRQTISSRGLDDPRLLGIILLAVIGLSVMWNGARVIQQNYGLLQKISIIEEENRILELQNSNRKIQIEYYKTPEFAELKARRVNGKAAKGETVYIIADGSAGSALKTPETPADESLSTAQKPAYQENFEAWMNFFFGS